MDRRGWVAITAAGVLVGFGAGAVTGVLASSSTSTPPRKPAASRSVLDQAERTIASTSAHPVSKARLQRAAVQGMLNALDDRWAAYYEPQDYSHFQQVLAGAYTGVGIWVRRSASGTLIVSSVEPDTPAAAAGLHARDVLVAVAGDPVAGRGVANVVSGLRGDPGTAVTVEVRRGARHISVMLRRARVNDDDVHASMMSAGIEQLRIAAFTRGVGSWVRSQVRQAVRAHRTGIVLDLRDDPGGLLNEAVETASAFLASGPVVSYVERGHTPQRLAALGGGNTSIPLVVLVNGGTASAAEIVTGALQDRGRAVVVGSQTFGKGSVQEPSRLSDGSALELTVGHYLTPSGRSLDGVGITPDVSVPTGTPHAVLDQRLVAVLSGITADAGSAGPG